MSVSRVTTLSLVLLAAPGLFACRQNPLVKPANPPPRAVARANTTEIAPGGSVTLDATGSTDINGTVAGYRWLSGTKKPDGTPGRNIPPGVPEGVTWPADGPTVTVTLPEQGWWVFTLWVVDDLGAISDPSTVTIKVGSPTEPSPTGGTAAPAMSGGAGGAPAAGGGTGGGASGAGGAGGS
jgi:hypothetical protein